MCNFTGPLVFPFGTLPVTFGTRPLKMRFRDDAADTCSNSCSVSTLGVSNIGVLHFHALEFLRGALAARSVHRSVELTRLLRIADSCAVCCSEEDWLTRPRSRHVRNRRRRH